MHTKLLEGTVIKSEKLPIGEWLVVESWEQQPQITIGNRMSSYENSFKLVKLDGDGSFNEHGDKLTISTCYISSKRIEEDEITIVRKMKKTYIK